MKKYRFIETFRGWKDGSGWSYETCNDDRIEEYDTLPTQGDLENYIMDTNQEGMPEDADQDTEITWDFYDAAEAEKTDNITELAPALSLSAWINDTLYGRREKE